MYRNETKEELKKLESEDTEGRREEKKKIEKKVDGFGMFFWI